MKITTGKIEGAQKIVIYGPEGIGKSSFAAKFPNPLFIDTEGSTKHMDVARTPKPSSWTMLMEQVKYVKDNSNICGSLIIDTSDWAEQMCIADICAKYSKKGIEDFGFGKGYVYLMEEFGKLLNRLEEVIDVGINVGITAHAQMRKFDQPAEMGSYDRWELKLQKKTAPLLKEWADMVLFANYKTYVVNVDGQGTNKGKNKPQGGKRVMYTTHHLCWDAKNRHDLPEELPFEYKQIAHCLLNSAAKVEPAKEVKKEPEKKAPEVKEKTTYWHHQESNSVFELKPGQDMSRDPDFNMSCELTKPEYDQLKAEYETAANVKAVEAEGFEQIKTTDDDLAQEQVKVKISPDIPKALADLMATKEVTELEIQEVVAKKGYYPIDTPIKSYDPDFVNGVLVGAWTQVFTEIDTARVPF
ncbi:MAG: ATP-binding protein [Eubacteriaceae bacterium]|nr:ATP-binding protein [Eubacteriaceae bacterium]